VSTPTTPSIAQTVHYTEAGDGSGDTVCRAGIITAHGASGGVSITVVQGANFYGVDDCVFDDDTRPTGTWHWPAGDCGN
jgi:hypothetical protein